MIFYDLGDNDENVASPYRLCIPERGINVEYETPGSIIFASTTYGRALFGLDGETHHADLKVKLSDGERLLYRGVMWPRLNAMVVWEFFSSMEEFREFMRVVARGLENLDVDPGDVMLYLGYVHRAFDGNREYDSYNVEMSVSEACGVEGSGDVNDCLYKMFLVDRYRKRREDPDEREWRRNIWRHYEVVGEGRRRRKVCRLDEDGLREVVRQFVLEEIKRHINGGRSL